MGKTRKILGKKNEKFWAFLIGPESSDKSYAGVKMGTTEPGGTGHHKTNRTDNDIKIKIIF